MSVAQLAPMSDVERLVSVALRANESVTALVEQRVFTTWPHARDDVSGALVLITRIGGAPVFSRPLALDEVELQLDCYGSKKHACWKLWATVAQALVELTDTVVEDLGIVHGVTVNAVRYVPDEAYQPPRPRYVADVSITASPPRPVVVARSSPPVASSEGR